MRASVMLYCQHLAGIGHLVRTTELARALHAEGWDVLLVCGGNMPPNYTFPSGVMVERLEALQSDPEYTALAACAAGQSLDEVKTRRTKRLLALFDLFAPDALITEMYPFGRKKFAFELLPLLERARKARPSPVIAASVRDILVRKRDQAEHERRVLEIVNRYYDLVLVHSDELMQPLKATYALAGDIRPAVIHTGYIVSEQQGPQADAVEAAAQEFVAEELLGNEFILVSCGSGRLHAGQRLIDAALESAFAVTRRFPHEILICAGPLTPAAVFARYERMASGRSRVHLVHDLPFLRNLLEHTALSVSLGGYNTVMEVLASHAQALVFPAEPNGDDEQRIRVESLAAKGQIRLLSEQDLISGRFAERIEEALRLPLAVVPQQMDGAGTSAQVLNRLYRARRSEAAPAGAQQGEIPVAEHRNEGAARSVKGQWLCA